MKRRVFLLLGATTMTVASVAGISGITATPAAAQTAPTTGIGYVIGLFTCFTDPLNLGSCIRQNLRGLLGSLFGLPPTAPNSTAAPSATPVAPGSNAPTLNLPANITGFLRTLPPALQTAPVAPVETAVAPVNQLIPTPVLNRGLTSSAPSLPTAASLRSSLPKLPTATEIRLLNIADNSADTDAGSPINASDVLMLVGLGAAAAAVTAASRRRAAAHS